MNACSAGTRSFFFFTASRFQETDPFKKMDIATIPCKLCFILTESVFLRLQICHEMIDFND